MTENPTIATVFYRTKPTADFYAFRFLLEHLLNCGVKVHCVCSAKLRLKPHPNLTLHTIAAPSWVRRAWYARTLFELVAPLFLYRVVRQYDCRAIVTTKCEWSFLAVPARLLSRRKLVTYVEALPWTIRAMSRRSRLRRRIGLIADYLGLCSSTLIITAGETVASELRRRIPFVAGRVHALKIRSSLPDDVKSDENGAIDAESWRQWLAAFAKRRKEFAEKHQIPERWSIVTVPVELVRRAEIETLLRAVSALESDRIAVLFCGHNLEREFTEALTVGLGLGDQVIFLDNPGDYAEALAASDLYLFGGTQPGASRALSSALGRGLSVLAADAPENREILASDDLLFRPAHVQGLLEHVEQALDPRQKGERIRNLSRKRALELAGNWGAEVYREILL